MFVLKIEKQILNVILCVSGMKFVHFLSHSLSSLLFCEFILYKLCWRITIKICINDFRSFPNNGFSVSVDFWWLVRSNYYISREILRLFISTKDSSNRLPAHWSIFKKTPIPRNPLILICLSLVSGQFLLHQCICM